MFCLQTVFYVKTSLQQLTPCLSLRTIIYNQIRIISFLNLRFESKKFVIQRTAKELNLF